MFFLWIVVFISLGLAEGGEKSKLVREFFEN